MLNKFKFPKNQESEEIRTVFPPANIYEHKGDIVIDVEMPGVDKTGLTVTVDGNILKLKGTKTPDKVDKAYQLIHQERQWVEYQRSFELSSDIDTEKIDAKYENGLLKVFLKRSAAVQPKKIEIQT
jgi:HSP20 family protein